MQIRPRIPDGLAQRIDGVRGDVPFGRWVVRACEERLARAEADSGIPEHPLAERVKDIPNGAPLKPPAPPRAPKKRETVVPSPEPGIIVSTPEGSTTEPLEQPTEADQQPQGDGMPTSVQLAQRAGVTLSVARRWLESGEWALYWT